jgi:hypothetical protein
MSKSDDAKMLALLSQIQRSIEAGNEALVEAFDEGNKEILKAIRELGAQMVAGTTLLGNVISTQLANHETGLQKLESKSS